MVGKNKWEFWKKPSVAVNFCCKDMSVHKRKDIDFEGEGDRLLSLAYSTSSPFILLLMWLFRGKLDLACILNVYITRLLNWSLMLFACSKCKILYIIVKKPPVFVHINPTVIGSTKCYFSKWSFVPAQSDSVICVPGLTHLQAAYVLWVSPAVYVYHEPCLRSRQNLWCNTVWPSMPFHHQRHADCVSSHETWVSRAVCDSLKWMYLHWIFDYHLESCGDSQQSRLAVAWFTSSGTVPSCAREAKLNKVY